jgi:peptidoglycan/LPS O-acetylase OafA/YrhL
LTLGHRPALDGLRGAAVLLVIAFHVFGLALPGGFVGVDLFLVLSGFLITTLLLREREATGRISLARFYGRRALRLMPAVLLLLAACAGFVLLFPGSPLSEPFTRGIATTVEYASNWYAPHADLGYLRHTWSLSLEEQFYLLWPLLLMVALAVGGRGAALVACIAGIGASIEVRVLLELHGGVPWDRLYMGLDTRADTLLIGCGLALLMDLGLLARLPRRALVLSGTAGALGLGLVSLLLSNWSDLNTVGYTGVAVCSAALLAAVVTHPSALLGRLFALRPLVSAGRISYGLYLWHYPMLGVLTVSLPLGSIPRPLLFVVVLGAAWAIAGLSYTFVERPCLAIKLRLSPRLPEMQPHVLGEPLPAEAAA